jgi:tRNA-dihydrouridine synthase
MSCESHNATPPAPAIAPGSEGIDPAAAAFAIGTRGVDPRLPAAISGFDAPFFQAGLAGYSDAAMRIVARRHGCPVCITEALLDRTLLAGGRGFDKADLGDLHDNVPGGPDDHPLVVQIMGSDPREMAAAAVKLVEQRKRTDREYRLLAHDPSQPAVRQHLRDPGGQQIDAGHPNDSFEAAEATFAPTVLAAELPDDTSRAFQAIDVNLACPVKKIERKARGGHWLAEPEGAIRILEAVREAVPKEIPCTVKLRRSFADTPEMAANFEKIFAALNSIGYAWATVHARTVQQRYIGPSRWDILRDLVRRYPDSIVFGSGDVWGVDDIFRMITYTGVHAVSVARGCIGNPWIFRQAREMMAGRKPNPPTIAEQRAAMLTHFEISLAVTRRFKHGEDATSKMMRKFGIKFAQHHPRGDEIKRKMISVNCGEDWHAVLNEFYPESHG